MWNLREPEQHAQSPPEVDGLVMQLQVCMAPAFNHLLRWYTAGLRSALGAGEG